VLVGFVVTALVPLVALCSVPAVPAAPSPPSGQIAYVHMVDSGVPGDSRDEVWIMGTDGSDAHRICGYLGPIKDLQWAPDGERLAFITQLPGQLPALWLMAAGGGERRQVGLSLPTAGGFAVPTESFGGLAWSPDGSTMALSYTVREGEWAPWQSWILLVAVDSGEVTTLVGPDDELAYHDLAWDPDGSQIVCSTSSVVGESGWLSRIDAATGAELGDLVGPGYFEFWSSPAFSPNGEWLASAVSSSAAVVSGEGPVVNQLVVVSLDGATRRVVATSTRDFLATPSWSPDGQWIVAGKGRDDPLRVMVYAVESNARESFTGVYGRQPAWRPILPPPAPSLRLAAGDIVEGEPLRVSGVVEDDGHGPLDAVRVHVGRQTWDLRVDGAGRYRGELRPQPGDYEVRAAAVREGVEGESSPQQALSVRSRSAALFGFDEGPLGIVHSVGVVRSWTAPLRAKGWTAAASENSDAASAARLMQGKGLVVFYGHGLYVRAPGGDGALPGFALAFDDSYLATTDKVVAHAAASGSPRWTTMESVDLSALEVAVYLGCGTGANAGNRNSLLAYTTGSGAAAAVGFTREVHALFETTPWLNAFRDYVLEDACDVRTAAFRAEQDCAVFGSMAVVAQRREAGAVYLDQAPARVEAGGGGGW